ncbi:MAG TPA: glycoside hydrolase family 31 protein [Chitinophagaceae bacterium]|nr:glycoside hydrolase family 31 protein [Chitinophagaceae bacterium]HPH30468.1 glycoside hydrolase family 31 protein [Chitinophagaceae bacterium]HPN57651.1 glycoside hydrolase family 31 protein [Chitinophagaceae bacterium]
MNTLLKLIILFFSFAFTLISHSQPTPISKTPTGFTVACKDYLTELQVYSPGNIRVKKYPKEKTFNPQSLSVTAGPVSTPYSIKTKGTMVTLKTTELNAILDLNTGALTFTSLNGTVLLREQPDGTRFTSFNDAGTPTLSVKQTYLLDTDEAIYGLGQQQKGKMIQRNLTLKMIQDNTDDYVPFVLSAKGYGIFWDNYSPTVFSDDPSATSFSSEVGEGIDYYFIKGTNADAVIAGMRTLTGASPMLPLWTFGFWQSKERYKTQDEPVEVVRRYRQLGVPIDGIIQDWQYWSSNYLWNAMEFLNPDFGNPKKMISDIHGLHAHIAISIWNSFGPETKQYRELDSIKALMNFGTWPLSGVDKWPPLREYPSGVKVYDPYNPQARDIYWKYLSKMHALGLDAWWMDSSEPDHLDFKDEDLNNKTYLGSFRKVRNAFPLMTVGGVYTHQRQVDSSKRIFILTRSAFAGQQRYGANTWSGDVTASWNALRNQISAGLNFSLTGIPYWNSDIGGFFLGQFRKPLANADYRELYTRWLQFGTFCPMMRSHGTDAPREIYQFGSKGEPVYDAIEKYIRLRYRLLPYIYSTSWQVTHDHSSMMRALVMDFANDKKTLDINDQFMFGRSLLVAPVTERQYAKATGVNGKDTIYTPDYSVTRSRQVYLPAGTNWIDFWTGTSHTGGQTIAKETPLNIVPLYVKAGSILPMGPDVQYATEKKWDYLELRIYPGADGEFVLYEDENDNYNYERGSYSQIRFSWNDKKKQLTIADRTGQFPGMLEKRSFRMVLVNEKQGAGDQPAGGDAHKVEYEGKKLVISL